MRILSLDPEDTLKVLAVQALAAMPESLLLLDAPSAADGTNADASAASGSLFLHIGARILLEAVQARCSLGGSHYVLVRLWLLC